MFNRVLTFSSRCWGKTGFWVTCLLTFAFLTCGLGGLLTVLGFCFYKIGVSPAFAYPADDWLALLVLGCFSLFALVVIGFAIVMINNFIRHVLTIWDSTKR